MDKMLLRLETMLKKFYELEKKINEFSGDYSQIVEVVKEKANLEKVVTIYLEYKNAQKAIEDNRLLLNENDEELKELAKIEITQLEQTLSELYQQLKIALLPKDPNDEKNIIMEIRGAAGGDEGNIFAGDLFRMYLRYCESQRWKVEIVEVNEAQMGGYSRISFNVKGEGVYSRLKFESGAHRVQRVPATEAKGRVHTSTATVLVMPEADEVDVTINPTDLKVDTYRSGGAGGQHVNKTESAIRITHLPTGIIVECQQGRSQHENRAQAMRMLRTRILEEMTQRQEQERGKERRIKVGSGDRSEKIRTYNFPQNRLTDHRIDLTIHALDRIMEGDLHDLLDALGNEEQRLKLETIE